MNQPFRIPELLRDRLARLRFKTGLTYMKLFDQMVTDAEKKLAIPHTIDYTKGG